ncbi:hypothetical protein GOODEAATRI_013952, partial [Goodea atripinnis]
FRLFDEQEDVLILVFLEDIPTYLLSPYHRMRKLLKKQTYLSWPRAADQPEVFWEKLRKALQTGNDPCLVGSGDLVVCVPEGTLGPRFISHRLPLWIPEQDP